eukprot:66877_1
MVIQQDEHAFSALDYCSFAGRIAIMVPSLIYSVWQIFTSAHIPRHRRTIRILAFLFIAGHAASLFCVISRAPTAYLWLRELSMLSADVGLVLVMCHMVHSTSICAIKRPYGWLKFFRRGLVSFCVLETVAMLVMRQIWGTVLVEIVRRSSMILVFGTMLILSVISAVDIRWAFVRHMERLKVAEMMRHEFRLLTLKLALLVTIFAFMTAVQAVFLASSFREAAHHHNFFIAHTASLPSLPSLWATAFIPLTIWALLANHGRVPPAEEAEDSDVKYYY